MLKIKIHTLSGGLFLATGMAGFGVLLAVTELDGGAGVVMAIFWFLAGLTVAAVEEQCVRCRQSLRGKSDLRRLSMGSLVVAVIVCLYMAYVIPSLQEMSRSPFVSDAPYQLWISHHTPLLLRISESTYTLILGLVGMILAVKEICLPNRFITFRINMYTTVVLGLMVIHVILVCAVNSIVDVQSRHHG